MPPFAPGVAKTAIAPIVAKPSGMSCEAELFLGPDDATKIVSSGRVPFASTGAAKNVSLPITMPGAPGSYHGYIDVYAGGLRFLAYNLTEDVVIAAPAVDLNLVDSLIIHSINGHRFSKVGVDIVRSTCSVCNGSGQKCFTNPWTGEYVCGKCPACGGASYIEQKIPYAVLAEPISKSKLDGVTLQFDYIGPSYTTFDYRAICFNLWHQNPNPPYDFPYDAPCYRGRYPAPTTGEGIVGGYRVWVVPFSGSAAITDRFAGGYYYPRAYDLRMEAYLEYYDQVYAGPTIATFRIKNAIQCTGSGTIS